MRNNGTILLLALGGIALYGWHAGWWSSLLPQLPAAPGGAGGTGYNPALLPSVSGPINLQTGQFGPSVALPQGGTATNAAEWIM